MIKFMVLYTGGGMPESEEEQAAVMGAWGAWFGGLGDALVDVGNPFNGSRNVSADGIKEGGVSSPAITGYTIINAESLDDAMAKVANHPHVNYGGQLSVYQTFDM